jgi:hypothetical protein
MFKGTMQDFAKLTLNPVTEQKSPIKLLDSAVPSNQLS